MAFFKSPTPTANVVLKKKTIKQLSRARVRSFPNPPLNERFNYGYNKVVDTIAQHSEIKGKVNPCRKPVSYKLLLSAKLIARSSAKDVLHKCCVKFVFQQKTVEWLTRDCVGQSSDQISLP